MIPPSPGLGTFDEALVAHRGELLAFCRRLAGGDHADDLAQDALERALRGKGSFDAQRPLGAWLKRIALNRWLDRRRERERRPATLESEPVDRRAADVARRADLLREIDALPAIEREALTRFHVRGESIAEIARALGAPENTVKSHLHRARLRLLKRRADA